ncbi:MAG: phenylalanine--tRNA ligase subunit beta [Phycisphaerales bacterium]|nr:phenylalanine--tRNA ligase subunit beta [Phycisphaerae bacterium]NNF41787.1 phenylalanine--tRNA ligase subunit beta [Phycisphaerales bacterium]NNM24862.1 phenylalanine--tRNA ligase subunit beta [Phycisphaerales bacterium]
MLTSVRWINDYLDPPATADEQAELATRAGFPLEGREDIALPDGTDVCQDFEMTSNRGDCVSHVGLAREIAAISGRHLKIPHPAPSVAGPPAGTLVSVTNREPRRCPLYTARIIRGATIKPSPDWLRDRLLARGEIPRNNVVDATNFVLFELGQPTHVFDLAKLAGPEIIVRMADEKESFLPLGEGERAITLTTDDLVIADRERAVALAGVKGGGLTAVTENSTDLLLEAATFDPVTVRNTSRRHGIASASSYRFERIVHPGQVNGAAERLAEIILEIAGGELCRDVVADGAPIPERRRVSMRMDRCRQLLGVSISDEQMHEFLDRLGFETHPTGERIECLVPVTRPDIEREIDLIEEVSRMFGHDRIPVEETIAVRVAPPQPTELARRAVADELVGAGFIEAVTHTLTDENSAEPFRPNDASLLRVDDDRARSSPILQPSVLPGLLHVRRYNADNGVGPLRLFESAAVFHGHGQEHTERIALGLVMDAEDDTSGLRPLRGVVERLATLLRGPETTLDVRPDEKTAWLAPGATVELDGERLGRIGRLAPAVARRFELDPSPLVAELFVEEMYASFPPDTEAQPLPAFPAIERDLSVVVADDLAWTDVNAAIVGLELDHLDAIDFVTTFRGGSVPAGRKSLTLRLRFRAPNRTLTHEEVGPPVTCVIETLSSRFAAEVRG